MISSRGNILRRAAKAVAMQVPAIEGLVRARDALLRQVSSLRGEMAELVRHRDDLLRQLSELRAPADERHEAMIGGPARSHGWIDEVDAYKIVGWALQPDQKTPDRIIISVDGHDIACVTPTLFRSDLRDLGLGDGRAGFRYFFPEPVGSARPARVVARSASTGQPLPRQVNGITSYESLVQPPSLVDTRDPFADMLLEELRLEHVASSEMYSAAVLNAVPHNCLEDSYVLVTGVATAPRGALPGVKPSDPMAGVEVFDFEATVKQIEDLPAGALEAFDLAFKVRGIDPDHPGLVTLHLVDNNSETEHAGPIVSPFARLCFPVTYEWLSPPPEENITRIWPGSTQAWWAITGASHAYQISSAILNYCQPPPNPELVVLDWGVGCGRVALPLKRGLLPACRIIGFDVDQVNVDWCQRNLHDIEVNLCDFYPPFDCESCSVDFAYGISVMTHLTEGAQMTWLKELRRVVRPGGTVVLTTNGVHCLAAFRLLKHPAITRELHSTGCSASVIDRHDLGPLLRIKDYYRGTFQIRSDIIRRWSEYFEVVAIHPAASSGVQDAVVLRRP
jgi:SAM-dependent methyltransferase